MNKNYSVIIIVILLLVVPTAYYYDKPEKIKLWEFENELEAFKGGELRYWNASVQNDLEIVIDIPEMEYGYPAVEFSVNKILEGGISFPLHRLSTTSDGTFFFEVDGQFDYEIRFDFYSYLYSFLDVTYNESIVFGVEAYTFA